MFMIEFPALLSWEFLLAFFTFGDVFADSSVFVLLYLQRVELENALDATVQRLKHVEAESQTRESVLMDKLTAQTALNEQRSDDMWRARFSAEADSAESRVRLDATLREMEEVLELWSSVLLYTPVCVPIVRCFIMRVNFSHIVFGSNWLVYS